MANWCSEVSFSWVLMKFGKGILYIIYSWLYFWSPCNQFDKGHIISKGQIKKVLPKKNSRLTTLKYSPTGVLTLKRKQLIQLRNKKPWQQILHTLTNNFFMLPLIHLEWIRLPWKLTIFKCRDSWPPVPGVQVKAVAGKPENILQTAMLKLSHF